MLVCVLALSGRAERDSDCDRPQNCHDNRVAADVIGLLHDGPATAHRIRANFSPANFHLTQPISAASLQLIKFSSR